MRKLLAANFARLWRDKCFWALLGATLAYALIWMLFGCRQAALDASVYTYRMENFYFHFAIPIGGFAAILGSMFFGTEYSDGTVRNKLVTGATRTDVYLSDFFTLFFAVLIMLAVWMAAALVGVPVLGFFRMHPLFLLGYFFLAVGMTASMCAMITLVCMHSTNKAATVMLSVLQFTVLLGCAFVLMYALGQQEMTGGVSITAEGMTLAEPMPNPRYVSGMKRAIFEFILDMLPTGQGIQMAFAEITEPVRMVRMLAADLVITVAVNFVGVQAYSRKNLK